MLFPKKKYTIWDCVRIMYATVPVYAAVRLLDTVIAGLMPSVIVLTSAAFVNKAVAAANGLCAPADVLPSIALFVGSLAFQWVFGALTDLINARMNQRFSVRMWREYIDFLQPIDYRYIEDQDSIDLARRIKKRMVQTVRGGYYNILDVVRLAVNVGSLFAIIMTQVWWAPIAVVLFSLPLLYMSRKSGKAQYEIERKNEKTYRHAWYLEEVLTSRDNVDERAMFDYSGELDRRWYDERMKGWRLTRDSIVKWDLRTNVAGVAALAAAGLIVLTLVNPLLAGTLSIGLFISLSSSTFTLVQSFSWQLSWLIDCFTGLGEYLSELTKMAAWDRDPSAELPPDADPPEFESLEFRDVSFAYPGTERKILDGLSFRMEKGKHYAIVGSNGAGKTTLAKIITGLYDCFEGEVLLNGRDIRSYPMSARKAMFSSVFQDFAKFEIPLKLNIQLGALPDPEKADLDRAVRLSGLEETVASLPQGIDTPLGKIDDGGQDISGGQWQRVAMARAVSGQRDFYILDEPTAALDPVAESRLYEEFGEISRGKTTVFITHRLGSVHLSDEIIVLENGRAAETGDFDGLIARRGLFAEMYETQRSWYI